MESKSPKEIQVEEKITALVTKIVDEQTFGDDLPLRLWNYLQSNQEIAAIQDYANIVSIGRLGLNDHGPVHMKIVCRNALKIEIHMKAEVGFFQVEEVLIPKIQSSPAKNLLELYAGVDGEDMKRYI